jgi:PelA/Pel-15E family pectate lyase
MRILLFLISTCSLLTAAVPWKSALKQKPDWYATSEAHQLAEKVMLYQRDNGGWPKNQDLAKDLSKKDLKKLRTQRNDLKETTIDNGATHNPLRFLLRIWQSKASPDIESSIHRGLSFLLKSQYPNGGWPQRPHGSGYSLHITFNDGAMIGVMSFLKEILEENPSLLTQKEKTAIKSTLSQGLDCILKTQIRVNGKPTVWCAQHNRETLLPAKARSYEHPSFSGGESADIVKYLMEGKDPSPEVCASIESAVAWFQAHQIKGIRTEKKDGNKVIIEDQSAPVLWARFYHLKTAKPIFSGRDGIIKFSFAEIESERRNGYAWYVNKPRAILKDYPAWRESLKTAQVPPR